MENAKGFLVGIVSLAVVALFISGLMSILAGFLAGLLIVFGLMMTIEQIPGFWAFATTGFGKLIVLIGTAWLTHWAFGAASIVGMIAMCTSLVFKVLLIESKQIEMGKRETFSFLEPTDA